MSTPKGFIAFPRSYFNTTLWQKKHSFTPTEALLDLYQMAHFGTDPAQRTIGAHSVTLQRGEVAVTVSFLCQRWGATTGRVRHWLSLFCNNGFINLCSKGSYSLITVNKEVTSQAEPLCNNPNNNPHSNNKKKGKKQKEEDEDPLPSPFQGEDAPTPAREGEAAEPSLFSAEELTTKPAKPSKPSKRQPFEKPTLEQVAEQCRLKGYALVDPEAFWAYYEANGWHVGKQSMRSWTAALAMWQARERDRQLRRSPTFFASEGRVLSPQEADSVAPSPEVITNTPVTTNAEHQITIFNNQTISNHEQQQSYPNPYAGPGISVYPRRYPNKRDAAFEALQQFRARQARDIARMDEAEPQF